MSNATAAKQLESYCDDGDEFEDLLYEAMDNAKPGAQEEFCLDMEKKWKAYGLRMFMSQAQWDYLQRLAKQA